MLPQEYAKFEDWQEDPKARYWNAWGYIGESIHRLVETTGRVLLTSILQMPVTVLKLSA